MKFESLLFEQSDFFTTVTINRLEHQNSISSVLLKDLHKALDVVEGNPKNKVLILRGQKDLFCTGMDFKEILSWDFSKDKIHNWATTYMSLLRRFATSSNVVVVIAEGKVIAGGVGLVAASDYVLSTPGTTFKLTEALWGLLPAMVAPYLMRRVGFQKAYVMTLLAKTIPAQEALSIGLVDEISELNDLPCLQRFKRLEKKTVTELKSYYQKMWILDSSIEQVAIDEITNLLQDPTVQTHIRNFVVHGHLPWK